MIFFEVFVPKGVLSADQRTQLGERILTELVPAEESAGAPAEVLDNALAIQQVVVYEPDAWIVGGRALAGGEPPRYVVRVSVPSTWRKEMSEYTIGRITKVLADLDGELGLDPRRLYKQPDAWIHVVGVPEGSLGASGHVLTSADVVRMITKPFRESPEREAAIAAAELGTAVDPVCGMTVQLGPATITYERGDTTYGFCSPGCLQVFKEELAV
jgi:YHS domain-containing protein